MKARAVLEVNLSAIKQNISFLKKMAQGEFLCPMVKADAYGHGMLAMTKLLIEEGIKQVGVVSLDEACLIRKNYSKIDILIFAPLFNKNDLLEALQENVILVCCSWKELKLLAELKKKIRIHLKFDTGFSRLGFSPKDFPKLLAFLKDHPHIKLEGIASHLIAGEELSDKESQSFKQIQLFLELKEKIPNIKYHILNSSGIISQYVNELNFKLGVRPGITLYGIKPKVLIKDSKALSKWDNLALTLSSCLKSQIVALRTLSKGDSVSYGAYWKAEQDTTIATVSLGYADGLMRSFGKKRKVLFRGKKRPIVGTICMDFFMIALQKEDQEVQLGEEVIIFDSQSLSPEEQAENIDTISYELFCSLSSRVKRIYK
ncbi:MAG: alanine racemase [Bdellovibrionales bacterium]|nr:alanine racemase [Bdellovibrionales bacterium]